MWPLVAPTLCSSFSICSSQDYTFSDFFHAVLKNVKWSILFLVSISFYLSFSSSLSYSLSSSILSFSYSNISLSICLSIISSAKPISYRFWYWGMEGVKSFKSKTGLFLMILLYLALFFLFILLIVSASWTTFLRTGSLTVFLAYFIIKYW